jgi:hypothetical protein
MLLAAATNVGVPSIPDPPVAWSVALLCILGGVGLLVWLLARFRR